MKQSNLPPGFKDVISFSLIDAILGRRSRRFFMGGEIPDGVFANKSKQEPFPLTEMEKLLVVAACGGNTGWHNMIYRGENYVPYLSNYAAAAGGAPSHRRLVFRPVLHFLLMMTVFTCLVHIATQYQRNYALASCFNMN